MIELGQKVKDKVTGFEGIAVAKIEYLNGCVQFCVKPKMKAKGDGKLPKGEYFDEGQLVLAGKGVRVNKKKPPGGVMSDMPGDSYTI